MVTAVCPGDGDGGGVRPLLVALRRILHGRDHRLCQYPRSLSLVLPTYYVVHVVHSPASCFAKITHCERTYQVG